jgi:hypothetical protein
MNSQAENRLKAQKGLSGKKSALFIFVLIFFLVVVSRIGLAQESAGREDTSCATLLLTKCDSCHYLTRVCYRVGKKSKRGWKRTLKSMVRYGAKLTEEQQNILLTCLTDSAQEVERFCREYLGK